MSKKESSLENQLNAALNNPAESLDIPDFSQSIMAKLQADSAEEISCTYDFEFVSAYYDQEWGALADAEASVSLARQQFEKHLPACPPCNSSLANISALSFAYKKRLYRFEEKLENWTILDKVIQRLQKEKTKKVVPFFKSTFGGMATAAAVLFVVMMGVNQFNAGPIQSMEAAMAPSKNASSVADALDVAGAQYIAEGDTRSVYESPEAYLLNHVEPDTQEEDYSNPHDVSAYVTGGSADSVDNIAAHTPSQPKDLSQ